MKDHIDEYLKTFKDKHIRPRQLYELYCLYELSCGRTPLARYTWDLGMSIYFAHFWKFITRVGQSIPLRHNMGVLSLHTVDEDRYKYAYYWRKYKMHVTRRWGDLYMFLPIQGDTNFGQRALQAWVAEVKQGKNMKGMTVFE